MPGSSLGTCASSMRPPPGATTSGTAFDRPPAPTSWIMSTGLSSPSDQQASMTCCARRCISGLPRCTDAKSSASLAGAAALRRGRAAAEPDEHGRAAEQHERRPRRHGVLVDVHAAHVAEPARDHDRLVVAAHAAFRIALHALLERAEVTEDTRPAELVVECRRTDRALEHDVERGRNAGRAPVIRLPGLFEPGNAQVRDREADQPGLRFRAAPGRALVADLAAGSGRGAGERRNCRRMVVRLDLEQDVDRLVVPAVLAIDGRGKEARAVALPRAPRHCRCTRTARRRGCGRAYGGSSRTATASPRRRRCASPH